MKLVYTLMRSLTILALMSWITFFLGGFAGLFMKVTPGVWMSAGVGVWVFFIVGLFVCQKGFLLHLYLPRFSLRAPTPEEVHKLKMAEKKLKTIQEGLLRQKEAFKKIYVTQEAFAQVWVYGGQTLVIPSIIIQCPTEGVLEGAIFHGYEQKLAGEGVKRSIRIFLTLVLRVSTQGKKGVEVSCYRPIHQKISQGKPVVFTREVVAWTGAGLGVIPWVMCAGVCMLIKGFTRLSEEEGPSCSFENISSGSPASLFYKKYLSLQEAMPSASRDIFDFMARRPIQKDKYPGKNHIEPTG